MGDEELIFQRQPEGKGGREKESLEEPDKEIKKHKRRQSVTEAY